MEKVIPENEVESLKELDNFLSKGIEEKVGLSLASIERAYNKYFFANYNSKNSNKDTRWENALSPASRFFQNVVAMHLSLIFSKFPEVKVEDNEIKEFIESRKEVLEDFFKKALIQYIVYGKCLIIINNQCNLEIVDKNDNIVVFNKYIAIEKKIDKSSKKLLQEKYPEEKIDSSVWEIYSGENRFIRISEGEFVDFVENQTNSKMLIKDNPIINYIWDLFCLLEKMYSKKMDISLSLDHYAVTTKKNLENVKQVESNKVLAMTTEDYNAIDPTKLISYNDNSPIANTIAIINQDIIDYKRQIFELSKLDSVFAIEKDNPTETRVAANNRVQVSSQYWQSLQVKVNNFVEHCLKAFLLENNFDEKQVNILEINSISILQEEFAEQKYLANTEIITKLVSGGANLSPEAATVNYVLAKEIAKKSNLSKEMQQALEILVISQEQMKQQAMTNQNPNPMEQIQMQGANLELRKKEAEIGKIKAETNKINLESQALPIENEVKIVEAKADVEKKQVETSLEPKRVEIAMKDEEQQLLDAKIRAEKHQIEKQNNY